MNVFERFRGHLVALIERMAEDGAVPRELDLARVAIEPPRDANHGDITTNAAMVLAGQAAMKPSALASLLAERLARLDDVADASVAGPGFVNLRLADSFWHARLAEVLRSGPAYGDSSTGGGEPVNVEFVSANPTGPLHVGHSRGAVIGDALAALLEKVGYDVTREYYVNDAGAQVDKLAYAAYWRYLEALGDKVSEDVIEGFLRDTDLEYRGEYLKPVGAQLAERDGDKWLGAAIDEWLPEVRAFAVEAMMGLIRRDLDALGIRFDEFTSERDLVAEGKVEDALRFLEDRDLVYTGVLDPPKGKKPDDWEPRPQTLFRASAFGDDVDRALRKSDGAWTYFATDIAYHLDKVGRGYRTMIDVWGRRSRRLREAYAGRGQGTDRRPRRAGREALPDGEPLRERRAGGHVEACRGLRRGRRRGRAGRQGRDALHHADAAQRRALGLRLRESDRADAREPRSSTSSTPTPGCVRSFATRPRCSARAAWTRPRWRVPR